jgi:hypothetical protein
MIVKNIRYKDGNKIHPWGPAQQIMITLSILFLALAIFCPHLYFGHELPKTSPVYWFMMQLAMLAGFLTSYPVNWWLVRKGIKEAM